MWDAFYVQCTRTDGILVGTVHGDTEEMFGAIPCDVCPGETDNERFRDSSFVRVCLPATARRTDPVGCDAKHEIKRHIIQCLPYTCATYK